MAAKKERQASLALIHLLNRGMTMAQAKAHLRETATKSTEATKPAKKGNPAKTSQEGAAGDGDGEGGTPDWLQQS